MACKYEYRARNSNAVRKREGKRTPVMFPSRSGLPSGILVVLPTRRVTRNRVTKAGKLRLGLWYALLQREARLPLKRGRARSLSARAALLASVYFCFHTPPSELEWELTSRVGKRFLSTVIRQWTASSRTCAGDRESLSPSNDTNENIRTLLNVPRRDYH